MNFRNPTLEKIYRAFKWSRNNTIQFLEEAEKNGILNFTSETPKDSKYKIQPIIYQFQCLATTTDTYYRKMTGQNDKRFGIYVKEGRAINKEELGKEELKKILIDQYAKLENLFKTFSDKDFDKNIRMIEVLSTHEAMHQGMLLLSFREAGIELPKRFKTAWAL